MELESSRATSRSPLRATSRSTLRATSRSAYRSTSRSTLRATSRSTSRSNSRSNSRPASRPASRPNMWSKAAKYVAYVVVLLVAISFVVSTIGPINTSSDLPINTSSDLPSQHRQHSAEFLGKKAKTIERYEEEDQIKDYDFAPGIKALKKLYCHPENLDTRHEDMLGEHTMEGLDQTIAHMMSKTSMLRRGFEFYDSGLLSPDFVAGEDHMTRVAMCEHVMAFDRARSAMHARALEDEFIQLMQKFGAIVTRVEKTKGKKGLGR